MAVTLGFNLAPDARAAASQFLQMMSSAVTAVTNVGSAIERFDSQGALVSRTFKVLAADGTKLEATLRQTAAGFELIGGKSDAAAASLKALAAQEEAAALAVRRREANTAEASLGGLKGLQPGGNANQINAAEAAIQRIRQAIESGSVSLQRFQQLYAQVTSNPKAIIPNLTAQEAGIVKSLRTIQTGFDQTGDKAQRMGERISISWEGMLRLFQAQVIKRATGALQSALIDGVQSAVDFSVRIAEIGTISQKSGVTTDQWAAGVRRLSTQFGASQADVAEGAYQALSNQITKGAETFEFLGTALRFGKATVTSTADSVNLLSSAMKSFDIPTSNSERVAGIFFKTIELGRVRGNEMADTFGRIGTIAADTGVSLEETAAAITTLTVKGMKFADASTLISNVLLKLLRPTAEMKELFAEWGVASGQAAIATFGFEGVLKKLDEEAQKGSNRLGELFNQIRAFRGAINLTGSSFADFQKNLAEITQGQGEFNRAVDIVMESFGDRVRRQMNEIKNYFSEEFGDGIISAVTKIAESLGGMEKVLGKIESVGTPVIVFLVGWKAATVAQSLVIGLLTTSTTASTVAVVANTTSTSVNTGTQVLSNVQKVALATANLRAAATQGTLTFSQQAGVVATNALSVAISTLNIAMGPFLAGFTLGMYLISRDDEARIERVVRNLEKMEGMKFDAFKAQDRTTSPVKDGIAQMREEFTNRFKIILQYQANQVKAADTVKKNSIQNLREVTEETKVSAKNYFDAITQGLKKIKDAAQQAKSMIEDSLKASEGVQRKLKDSIYDTRLKYASEGRVDNDSGQIVDEQKIGLMKTRLTEITQLARSKFKEGTKESVEDARRLYGEVEKLTTELFEQQTKKRRAQFDEDIRRGKIQPITTEVDPVTGQIKAQYDFAVKTEGLERRLVGIANEKLAAESKLRAEKERQLKIAQDLELREQARVKTIQQAISEIEKIKVMDDKGDPTDRFKNNPKDALAEFDRQARIARQAAAQLEVRDRLQTLDFLNKQREALEKSVNARMLAERTRTEQESTQIQAKQVKDRFTEVEKSFDNATTRMANDAKRVAISLGKIEASDLSLGERNPRGGPKRPGQQGWENGLRDLKAEAQAANEIFAKNKTKENLEESKKALDLFIEKYRQYIEIVTGKKIEDLDFRAPGMRRLAELEQARKGLQEGQDQQVKAQEDLVKLSDAGEKMKTGIQSIPGAWKLIDQMVGQVAPSITKSIESIISKTDDLIIKLEQTAELIRQMGGNPAPPDPDLPKGAFGGKPRTYAFGGRGSDDQLAYINRKETVMTGTATDNWSPLLQAMNAGMTPNQAMGGGNVTNVGDININMQGGAPAQQNVRTFAKTLRRALRRGTATLE